MKKGLDSKKVEPNPSLIFELTHFKRQCQNSQLALDTLGKKRKITCCPDFLRVLIIKALRLFTTSKRYGPYEFFLTAMAMDNVAPKYGQKHLKDFFEEKAQKLVE